MYIKIINQKWTPGETFIKDKRVLKDFDDYMAREYIKTVVRYVKVQKYKQKWAPLSFSYLKEKRRKGLSLNTWEATGELMTGLIYQSKGHIVTFDGRKRHKVSKKPYLDIARQNEYGNLRVPPRPLFRPVYYYMRKHVYQYYLKYLNDKLGG